MQHNTNFNYTTDTDVPQELIVASGATVQVFDSVTVRVTTDEVLTDVEDVKLFER